MILGADATGTNARLAEKVNVALHGATAKIGKRR